MALADYSSQSGQAFLIDIMTTQTPPLTSRILVEQMTSTNSTNFHFPPKLIVDTLPSELT